MIRRDKEPNVGAAILGMYAGIKIARAAGIDWRRLGEIVLPVVKENEERERDDPTRQ